MGGAPSTFDLQHANLLIDVAVNQFTDARVEFEWEHGAQNTEMDQVYLDFHPFEGGPAFVIGRFYAPFGIERRVWYPPTSMTVSRPLAFQDVVPGNWYETGGMLSWIHEFGPGELGVETAVTNGLGATLPASPLSARQNLDGNQNKMLSGRIGYLHESGLEVGASFASGKHDVAGSQSYRYLGADLQMTLADVELRGEFVTSNVEDPASPGGSLNRDGWYLQAFLPLLHEDSEFGVYTRLDSVDPNDDLADSGDRDAYAIGLRWVPANHLIFKFEFMKVVHDHSGPHPTGDEIRFQAVLDF